MALLLPTPDERKRLFRLIQQYSSWTAWSFVAQYHKVFVDTIKVAFEDTQINPPPDGKPLIQSQEMAAFLHGYASMESALAHLRRGDRTTYKFLGFGISGAPYFWEAYRCIHPWAEGIFADLFNARGMDFPPFRHAMFPRIEVALKDLCQVWRCNALCLETRHTDLPAPLELHHEVVRVGADLVLTDHRVASCSTQGINCGGIADMSQIPAADDLPEVPTPAEELLVQTGSSIPFDGIWEPVKAPPTKGVMGLFKVPQTPVNGEFEVEGCMNYLHQGSDAPTLAFDGDDQPGRGRPTVWRLLWKDERYLGAELPPEEAFYKFTVPANLASPPPPPPEPTNPYIGFTDELAMLEGDWVCESDANWRIKLKQGERFPIRDDGVMVAWIYQSDLSGSNSPMESTSS